MGAMAGCCGCVEGVCAMHAEDRRCGNVLTMTFPAARKLEPERGRAFRGFLDLISRTQAAGKSRDDFVAEGLPMLLPAPCSPDRAALTARPSGTPSRLTVPLPTRKEGRPVRTPYALPS